VFVADIIGETAAPGKGPAAAQEALFLEQRLDPFFQFLE
jgi:hypothetical protein